MRADLPLLSHHQYTASGGYINHTRPSLPFGDQYGIADTAHSLFRGTIRFSGWCDLMRSFSLLGLCDGRPERRRVLIIVVIVECHGSALRRASTRSSSTWLVGKLHTSAMRSPFLSKPDAGIKAVGKEGATWGQVLDELAAARYGAGGNKAGATAEVLAQGFAAAGEADGETRAAAAVQCLEWLGMGPADALPGSSTGQPFASVQAAFVAQLSSKLTLKEVQKDLIVMQHDFDFEWPEGAVGGARTEHHVSSLINFGGAEHTAMATTVGLTAAIGADLVLEGHLDGHTGLASPILPAVYNPGLERLAAEGFVFRERASLVK